MSWICPDCGRSFRNPNQSHSCGIVPIGKHFIGKPDALKATFDKIISKVTAFGHIQINSLNGAITIAGKSTFLAFKIRKDYIELEILSDIEISEFPVYKTFRVSKSRVALFVRIQSPDEVDEQLLGWIKVAYDKVGI